MLSLSSVSSHMNQSIKRLYHFQERHQRFELTFVF